MGNEDMFWRVTRASVGTGLGMTVTDQKLSDTVLMELWCEGLEGKSGRFVLSPDYAESVAKALLRSAEQAKKGFTPL